MDHELRRLLDALANGELTAEDRRRLDARLSGDADARRAYLGYMGLEAELFARHAAGAPQTGSAAGLGPAPAACSSAAAALAMTTPGRPPAPRALGWLALAAALVGVAAASSLATLHLLRPGVGDAPGVAALDPLAPVVARVTATSNTRWRGPQGGVHYGARLVEGQRLDLAAGLVEVTFDTGARILLEGPATLDLRGASEAMLLSGRLAVSAPAESVMLVRSERFGVEQTGAEYGLVADRDGGSEVHVFSGLVEARLLGADLAPIRKVSLAETEGVRVLPASTTLARIRADNDLFVRTLAPTDGPHDGLYAYEGFDYPAGPLGWQNGGFGWAGPWADIETAERSGEPATNRVADGSLAYGAMVPRGGRAVQTANRNRIRRALSTSLGGVFDSAGLVENRDALRLIGADGKRVYVGFLQRVDRTADVFYGLELHRGDGNANRVLCVGQGAEGAGYGVTSNYNSYGAKNFPSLGKEDTEVNMIVVRIDFHPQDFDEAVVYRNPQSLVEEGACEVSARLKGNFAFDRISLGNFDGQKQHEVDELRVGTTFRAVTGQRDRTRDPLGRPFAAIRGVRHPRVGAGEPAPCGISPSDMGAVFAGGGYSGGEPGRGLSLLGPPPDSTAVGRAWWR